jgi:hypothetical protein
MDAPAGNRRTGADVDHTLALDRRFQETGGYRLDFRVARQRKDRNIRFLKDLVSVSGELCPAPEGLHDACRKIVNHDRMPLG